MKWRFLVLAFLEFLGFSWGAGGRVWAGPSPSGKGWTEITKTPTVFWAGGLAVLGQSRPKT